MGPTCWRMGRGAIQPPRKRTEATTETTNISVYSARKNIAQKKPLYSVWKPATSALSASGMSNGIRFHSAKPAVKKIRKDSGLRGKYGDMNQRLRPPAR